MKKVLLIAVALFLVSEVWGQDWLKADWYATKKQVISKEGKPGADDDTMLWYGWRIASTDFLARYDFRNLMLQSVSATSDLPFNSTLEVLLDKYGKPNYRSNSSDKDRTFGWKLKKSWVFLVETTDPGSLVNLYPLDSDSSEVQEAMHPFFGVSSPSP